MGEKKKEDVLFIDVRGLQITGMLLKERSDKFAKKTTVSVMTRAAMEFALSPKSLDDLFELTAE